MADQIDPAEAFAELGRIRLAETDLDGVLRKVVELAKRTVPGADEVSVTLVRAEDAHSAAFTGGLARMLDEWQYGHDSGPCLAAAASGGTVSLTDLATEENWRQYAGRARKVSQDTNRKLRDVAAALVANAERRDGA